MKLLTPIRNMAGATIVWREPRTDRIIQNGRLIYSKFIEGQNQVINPLYWCEVTTRREGGE